jgi:hypothetical protein
MRIALVSVGGLFVLSCGGAIEQVGRSATLIEAKRSPAVVAYDSRGRGAYLDVKGGELRVCAEPFPDVTANLEAMSRGAFGASLRAAIPGAPEAGVSNESSTHASSKLADVATRTEILLVLREAMYRLCEMRMNGDLDGTQAVAVFDYILRTVRVLGERDNVSKLISALQNAPSELQKPLLGTIMSLSIGETLAASTELGSSSAQNRAAEAIREGLRLLQTDSTGGPP